MKDYIQNITIESLFEGDTETLYVLLRARAIEARMLEAEFHEIFIAAQRSGFIEIDTLGNVKLIEKRYQSTLTEGVKTANNLCAAVKLDMQMLFESSVFVISTDSVEVWEKRLKDSIEHNAPHFPRCGKPYVVLYPVAHYSPPKPTLVAYANERAYINNAPFITISVQTLNNETA